MRPLRFAAALMLTVVACGPAPDESAGGGWPDRSPRFDVVEELRADLLRPRAEADGGGSASVEELGGPAVAGRPGSWRIVYRAGPLGVAVGGAVYLQVSPFWAWSTPQVEREAALGFTRIATDAEDVDLSAETLDQQLLAVHVGGRPLREGERIEITYGAGPAGALADRYAERESRFWVAVDGDGDGVRELIAESPAVDVMPGLPARLLLHLPSTARPGDRVTLTAALVDAVGNGWPAAAGTLELRLPAGASLVDSRVDSATDVERSLSLALALEDRGRLVIPLRLSAEAGGVIRVRGQLIGTAAEPGFEAESNPLVVAPAGRRVLWADLQNHSGLSDGSATPDDLLRYAREVAGLDAAAVTDHDHWGMRFMDGEPSIWRRTLDAADALNDPGRFVALAGYEWTNWVEGHRHVVFFEPTAEAAAGLLLSSIDEQYDEPRELWAGLEDVRALTFAHHSAGAPIATDWSSPPPAGIEPVTEIVSVHGSSEAADSPGMVVRNALAGNFVRDALDRGYRLGFVGSSDGHDGHPGLGHLASPSGGVAAILTDEVTRQGIYEALLARRTYATNGPRIVVRASYAGWPIGADIPAAAAAAGAVGPIAGVPQQTLVVRAIAPGRITRIDVVSRQGAAGAGTLTGEALCGEGERGDGERECSLTVPLPGFQAGGYLYLRVVQEDGGAAWTSPFFFR
ncbi:MAG: DUF3604 domain-containing protein [Holophagales bacterium]|nr:DUF3604 domain-containing protein [Holophagales bacterium]MYG31656.1 DUF3604 domain-containing protein [Holophagales bacterium]MYI79498.1 DUF3604 domain-containing protein [Holophagales bacterium]